MSERERVQRFQAALKSFGEYFETLRPCNECDAERGERCKTLAGEWTDECCEGRR